MEIIPNGTTVQIVANEIKGTVIEASISGIETPLISYKVVWWAGGTRHEGWLESYEIKPYIDTSKKAGMVNHQTDVELSNNGN